MEGNVKKNLLAAIRTMMKPLVRLLVNQGVSHGDFADALKDVYVEVAIRHFGEDEKINRSQVAILSGLTRKEVKNVIDRAIESGAENKIRSRPERVLSGWHNDPNFTGPYGVPLELPYEASEGQKSFVELVKTYSGDMSPKAMLDELLRGGSIIEHDGVIKAIRRDFEPGGLSRELIVRFGEIGHKFFSTAASNIEKTKQGGGYFDRFVYAEHGCTPEVIDKFDEHVKKHGQLFLENLDNWLAANEKYNKEGEDRKDTGVYVVQYVETPTEKEGLLSLLVDLGIANGGDNVGDKT